MPVSADACVADCATANAGKHLDRWTGKKSEPAEDGPAIREPRSRQIPGGVPDFESSWAHVTEESTATTPSTRVASSTRILLWDREGT